MNELNNIFDKLQDMVNDCQGDVTKFVDGNSSAGTRVRKAMQSIKSLAQEIRIEVQDQKNSAF
jgi:hypothetical protein|tara:strand:- start:219 stop:407 length:189 start_codon:yes stop_codon:yes gene_type:complete